MKVAVLLSGCGIGDGSQVEEAMLTYLALDKYNLDYICVAPDANQFHTFNHYTEKIEENEVRNIMIEAARIGRGRMFPLNKVNFDEIDALILPGGQGIFKNFSDYSEARNLFKVDKDIDALLKRFHSQKKPIGAMCGAILIVAKSLEGKETSLKLGTNNNAFVSLFESTDIHFENIASNTSLVDYENRLVTTPAFLGTQNLYEMMLGIDNLVEHLRHLKINNTKV